MKKKLLILIPIILIIVISITYAFFSWQSLTRSNVTITAGVITVTYNGGPNINNVTLIPVSSKEKGVTDNTAVYKEITASSTEPTYMDLNLTLDTFPTGLKHKSLVWELYNGNNLIGTGNLGESNEDDVINLVTSESITSTTSTFKLYIWIDGNQDNPTTMMNQQFNFILNATATDDNNRVIVSFDANGGSVDIPSKAVRYNGEYGSLPTPTREGYTFKGWNGKNMFNKDDISVGYIDDNTGLLVNHSKSNSSNYISVFPNKEYIIRPTLSSGNWGAFYDENKNYISGFVYWNGNPILSPSNAKYIRFTVNYVNSNTNYLNTTQLEEGDKATPYEPYYVTSDVTVTQEKDHTLKAIWGPAS